MEIVERYSDVEKDAPFCVALGSFDGVHLGHQKLIRLLLEEAQHCGTKSMVYTFSKHPRRVLSPGKPIYLLTDNGKRAEIFERLGVDYMFLEEFTRIKDLGAEDFVKEVLINRFKAKCVIIGYNYRFGYKGEGNAEFMKKLGEQYGFKVDVVPAVEINGHTVSSSMIRHVIRSGAVENGPVYLGRPFSLHGTVVFGKQNGEAMGIKTANIEVKNDMTLPHKGVYYTNTLVKGQLYKSVTNIGFNPTFDGESLTVETHLIGFKDDIYAEHIEIFFLKRIRDEVRFTNMQELVEQIRKDISGRLAFSEVST